MTNQSSRVSMGRRGNIEDIEKRNAIRVSMAVTLMLICAPAFWGLIQNTAQDMRTINTRGRTHGVTVRVVLDREWLDESDDCADELDNYPTGFPYGELAEITHDWYAQDDSDNIWYLGEHTVSLDADEEECEDWADPDLVFGHTGCLDGSFESGVDEAEAGIVMLGDPSKGDFYQQEFDEDNAEDWGKVLNFVPVEESEDCLKTKEWTPLERGEIEHKYYCPDLGALVLIEEVSGGPTVVVDLIEVSSF